MLYRLSLIAFIIAWFLGDSDAEVYPLTVAPGTEEATIAVGDAIAFTSTVTGIVHAYLNCGSFGRPFAVSSGQHATIPFIVPGHYLGIITDQGGESVATVKVTVVRAIMTRRADQVGFTRIADFHVFPDASLVTFRSNNTALLDVAETGTDGEIAHVQLRAKGRGDLRIQALIQSPVGPRVIGEAPIDEFTIDTPSLREALIDANTGIGTTKLVMHPFVHNVIVTFTMFAHRSTFAGGAKMFRAHFSRHSVIAVDRGRYTRYVSSEA
jgi:hypothetical protein